MCVRSPDFLWLLLIAGSGLSKLASLDTEFNGRIIFLRLRAVSSVGRAADS